MKWITNSKTYLGTFDLIAGMIVHCYARKQSGSALRVVMSL